MRVAVVGSRGLKIDYLGELLPEDTTEIVSGGAKGIDTCAREYALSHNIKLTEFLPDYRRYGKGAPKRRNAEIVQNCDMVIALWDGKSRGTKFVIDFARYMSVPVTEYIVVQVKEIKKM